MPTLLHVHSWYSLLEGASSPDALLQRAAACGYTALALTDTNNLYGMVPFAELAHRHGVRPLLGACLRQHRFRCVALIDLLGNRALATVDEAHWHLAGELARREVRGAQARRLTDRTGYHQPADTDPVVLERHAPRTGW